MSSNHTRSSAEIEREIEIERDALARSIERLQEQFSPERILRTVTDGFRENGGDVARSFGRAARDNPIALALTGIGLAWLMAGGGPSSRRIHQRIEDLREDDDDDDADFSRPRPATGYSRPTPATASGFRGSGSTRYADFDRRVAEADAAIRHRDYASRTAVPGADHDTDDDGLIAWGRVKARARDFGRGASDRWNRATGAVSRAGSAVASGAGSVAEGARSGAGSVADTGRDAADAMRRGRDRVFMSAAEMRDRIWEGTEHMSDAARERVVAARTRAWRAQQRIESEARRRIGDLRRYAQDEPLVTAAVAVAAGAVVGALLPRTDTEDRYIGAYRDRAFEEADRIFREEAKKVEAVASAAVDEGKAILDEKRAAAKEKLDEAKREVPTGRDAVEKTESEVRDAASRIGEAAKSEAKKQDLGGSVSS